MSIFANNPPEITKAEHLFIVIDRDKEEERHRGHLALMMTCAQGLQVVSELQRQIEAYGATDLSKRACGVCVYFGSPKESVYVDELKCWVGNPVLGPDLDDISKLIDEERL